MSFCLSLHLTDALLDKATLKHVLMHFSWPSAIEYSVFNIVVLVFSDTRNLMYSTIATRTNALFEVFDFLKPSPNRYA